MKNLINTRPNEKLVYSVTEKSTPNEYIIERCSLPCLKVLYNAYTKKGKLYSFFSGSMPDGAGSRRSITKKDIDAAVKETIAWAKDNITGN